MLTSAEKENSSESEIEEESVESSEEEDEDSDESIEERKEHEIPRIDIKQPELYFILYVRFIASDNLICTL